MKLDARLQRLEKRVPPVEAEFWWQDSHANEHEGRPLSAFWHRRWRKDGTYTDEMLPDEAAWDKYSAEHPQAFAIIMGFSEEVSDGPQD